MPVVLISRLPHAPGEGVAGDVASRLGYKRIGDEVLQDASERSGIGREEVRRALYEGRSLFGMPVAVRKRCIAHFQAALCARLVGDDVVFDGPLGHLLIMGVSHVLKVRITAPLEARAAVVAAREGWDEKKAGKAVVRDDKGRLSIAETVFGANDDDESLFNLVIDTSKIDERAAAQSIVETVAQERYRPSTYSLECMRDIELSSRVRTSLLDLAPEAELRSRKGSVRIRVRAEGRAKDKKIGEVRRMAEEIDGVKDATVEAVTGALDLGGGWLR